jgi:hypothetical protein
MRQQIRPILGDLAQELMQIEFGLNESSEKSIP